MFCHQCGAGIDDPDDRFCSRCGAPLHHEEGAEKPAAGPASPLAEPPADRHRRPISAWPDRRHERIQPPADRAAAAPGPRGRRAGSTAAGGGTASCASRPPPSPPLRRWSRHRTWRRWISPPPESRNWRRPRPPRDRGPQRRSAAWSRRRTNGRTRTARGPPSAPASATNGRPRGPSPTSLLPWCAQAPAAPPVAATPPPAAPPADDPIIPWLEPPVAVAAAPRAARPAVARGEARGGADHRAARLR